MKIDRIGLECVENKFLKLPNIQKYEVVHRTEDGFIASVEMDDGYEFHIDACFLNRVFPSTIIKLIEKQDSACLQSEILNSLALHWEGTEKAFMSEFIRSHGRSLSLD